MRTPRSMRGLVVGALVVLAGVACADTSRTPPPTSQPVQAPPAPMETAVAAPTPLGGTPDRPFGARTRDTGCAVHDALADSACTPGAVFPDVTAEQVCRPGYSSSVRNVPAAVSRGVYAAYGIAKRTAGEYEVDHLVPLEIGGSNDIANLWPEAAEPRPGFHEKDVVENYLHAQVCTGNMRLIDAQRSVATNWVDVYQRLRPRVPQP
jgi:hypothetical protein